MYLHINKIKDMLKRENLFKGTFILTCSFVIGGVFGFLFHISIYRLLGKSEYSNVAVLLGIILFFSVFSQLFQTVTAKLTAMFYLKDEPYWRTSIIKIIKWAAQLSVVILIAYILSVPFVTDYLNMRSRLPLVITGVSIIPLIFLGVCRGILQGKERFFKLGALIFLENIFKVSIALLLIFFGLGFLSGAAGIAGALLLTFLAGLSFINFAGIFTQRHPFSDNLSRLDVKEYTIHVFPHTLLLMAILNLDIFLVKHYLQPEIAGQYQAAAFIARLIVFVAIATSQVVFSKTAAVNSINKDSLEVLKGGLFIVIIGSVFFYLFVKLFGGLLINLFYGPANALMINLLPRLILAFGMLGIIYNLVFFHISVGVTKYWWGLLIFICLEASVISLFHGSPAQIANNLIYLMLTGAFLLFFVTFRKGVLRLRRQ